MLRTNDNMYVAGHHINRPKERDQIIQEVRPDIVCVDKPQDLQVYAQRLMHGTSLDEVTRQLEQDIPGFSRSLFTRDYIPLTETCRRVGVSELYFVDSPSYVSGVTPFFIEDSLGVADQSFRDGLISLRAKEVNVKSPKERKMLVISGSVLQLKVYRMLELIQHYDASLVQDDKEKLYNALDTILLQMKNVPELFGSPFAQMLGQLGQRYNAIELEYQSIRTAVERGEIPAERLEQTLDEAKKLTNQLDILTIRMIKAGVGTDLRDIIMQQKRKLDDNWRSEKLKQDILLQIKL